MRKQCYTAVEQSIINDNKPYYALTSYDKPVQWEPSTNTQCRVSRYSLWGEIMAAITLKADTAKALREAVADTDKASKKWVKATDLLIANGITSKLLESRKDGENDKLRTQVKNEAIIPALPAAEQALLAKDTKALKDAQKKQKRELIQKVGRYLTGIETHLKTAEKKAAEAKMTDEEREAAAANSAKTDVQRIQAKLDEVLSKLGKLENASFDVPNVTKLIKAAKGAMPAV